MNEYFVKVKAQEIQKFQTDEFVERFRNEACFDQNSCLWFIPVGFYNEVFNNSTLIIDKNSDVKMNDLLEIGEQISNGTVGGSTENTSWILQ